MSLSSVIASVEKQSKIWIAASAFALLAMTTFFTTTAHAQDYTSNLIGHWALDETTGSTITDSGSGGNNGTWSDSADNDVSGETTPGQKGTALHFDGANDLINIGDIAALELTGDMTIAAWIYMDTAPSPSNAIFNKLGYAPNRAMAFSVGSGSLLNFTIAIDGSNTVSRQNATALNAGQWYHLVGVYDATAQTMDVYVNGTLDNGTLSGTIPTSQFNATSEPFLIGNRNDDPTSDFDGLIDDVRMYDRALSAADVADLYAAPDCTNPDAVKGVMMFNDDSKVMQYCNGSAWATMGPSPVPTFGLVAHYTLNETSGTTAADSAGSNDGTMEGGLDAGNDSVAGQTGTALHFDGTDDLIDVGNWEVPSGDITIAAWVYVEDIAADGSRIISKSLGPSNTQHTWQVRIKPNGNINTVLTTTVGTQENEGGSGFFLANQDAWHHVALTYDSNTDLITYYIDGVQVDTDTHSDGGALDTSSGNNIAIGNNPTGAGADPVRAWDGYLDDVRVYDDALSTSEISSLYAATITPPTSDLIAHYTLNETSGSTITDSGSGSNNGTWTDNADNDVTDETTSNAILGTALDFDGTDDLIDIGNWEVPSGNITMAAWVYVEGISTDGSRIISKTSGTNWPDHTWQMRIIPNGNINTVLTTTIGAQESEGGSGFFLTNQNAWHHVALTYNSSTDLITYYIDGVQVDTDTHSDGGALDTSSGDNIAIGNNPTSAGADSSRAWDGYLDDVRVYDDALTPSEISNLYAATNNFCKNPSQPAGTILFNTDVNAMQYCNGSNWAAMGPSSDGGGGGCSNPTGLQAELRYNFDLNVVQYCEGDEWIAIH